MFRDRVVPQDADEAADRQQVEPVDRDGDALGGVAGDVLREHVGGKRQQRHEEQQYEVEAQQDGVRPFEVLGDDRVAEPGLPDRREAHQVGEVDGPLVAEFLGDVR